MHHQKRIQPNPCSLRFIVPPTRLYTLANSPINKNCAMAITNKNCTRFDLLECEIVATDEEFDESGKSTYFSDRSCGSLLAGQRIRCVEGRPRRTRKNALAQNV